MGLVHARITLKNPRNSKIKPVEIEALADSGALRIGSTLTTITSRIRTFSSRMSFDTVRRRPSRFETLRRSI